VPRFITRTHTEEITPDHLAYEVRAEGAVPPLNEEIVIENLGPEVLKSPQVLVDGQYNWGTAESMAAEITRGCGTDEEKALAIYNWVRTHGDHQYSGDRKALNPVVFFNVFGHGICAYFASTQTALARAVGLRARVWEIEHHTVAEIYYDGAWHMLDPDCHLFFLKPDNCTIASIADIEQDLALYSRTEAYERRFADAHGVVRNEWQSLARVERYDLSKPRYVQYDYDPYTYAPASMDYDLLPGETMTRCWKGWGKYYDYRNARKHAPLEDEPHKPFPPACYGNGHVLYRVQPGAGPDPEHFTCRNIHWTGEELRVAERQDSTRGARSLFAYERPLPYLLVGGRITGEARRDGAAAYDVFNLVGYRHTSKMERQVHYEQKEPGRVRFDVDLDDFLYPDPEACAWEHAVHVELGAYAGNEPQATTALTSLEVRTEFQVAPRSLPAMQLGDNRVEVAHATPADTAFRARVTHTWTERHGIALSKAPAPLAPEGEVEWTGGIRFAWKGRSHDEESYHFQLSLHPQCAFPLSPNFDADRKSPDAELTVEEGWLRPQTRYFWRADRGRGLVAAADAVLLARAGEEPARSVGTVVRDSVILNQMSSRQMDTCA